MWKQYDGVPPHFGREVMECLNILSSEMDMRKYLMAAWQVLSPGLSLLVFFCWECMNSRVCHNGRLQSRQHA